MTAKRGQVALYLLMVLVALCLLAIMNVDVFVAVRAKNRVQNAGDAATLAAARRQGLLLNEIGRLNIDHIVAAALRNDTNECEAIVLDQRKRALLGPVEGLRDANEAAKKNGMEVRDEFAAILAEHVVDIRTVYAGGGETGDPYPEPWPGAWGEYAAAIENVIAEGLATGPDNMEFYDAAGGHMLLNRNFYFAISGKNWCWFHFNCEDLLKNYTSWHDWGPLPTREESSMENGEIFSLHVKAFRGSILDVFEPEDVVDLVKAYGEEEVTLAEVTNSWVLASRDQTWFFFDDDVWRNWYEISPFGEDGGYAFPVVGEVRREYDLRGCAAICRCVQGTFAVATDQESDLTWAAAAKPFGKVVKDGADEPANAHSGFVVPCFSAVRLVPLDAVGGEELATADFGWVNHVRHHLPDYLEKGPRVGACFYCLQLETWERDSFRREGERWIEHNAGSCIRGTGGPGGHGGTSHGH